MAKWKILGFLSLVLLTAGCHAFFSPNPVTKDITSANGKFRITVPGGWVKETTLNKSADIQASHRGSEMYVIVLSESKDDFHNMSLEGHSKLTREALLEKLSDPQISEPKTITVAGYPALRYEIRGGIDLLNIVYLHTTVESPKYFHQILAWTLPSRIDQNRATLEKVVETFREVAPESMPSRGPSLSSTPSPAPHPTTKDVTSTDGKFYVSVPSDWVQETTVNKTYDILAMPPGGGMFVMVFQYPKKDFHNMTLEEHSKLTRDALLKKLSDPQVYVPNTLTIAGYPALRYEIRGRSKLSSGVYLHTTVESPHYFYSIQAWTLLSRLDQNRDVLEKVVGSFRIVTSESVPVGTATKRST